MEKARTREPAKYQAILATIRVEKGKTRSVAMKADADEFMSVMLEEENEIENDRTVMMPKRQFKVWHKINEEMTEDFFGRATQSQTSHVIWIIYNLWGALQ